jgi:predicted MFS family arabinose efflux permease
VVLWLTAYETTIVATVPFVSELAPGARERLLSLMAAVIAVGRGAGALVAGPVYAGGGIAASGLVAAGCVVAAAVLLVTVPSPTRARQ